MNIIIIFTFILLVLIQSLRLLVRNMQLKAIVYFIVDKGYTEPTTEEMDQCIKIVVRETIKDWFREQD